VNILWLFDTCGYIVGPAIMLAGLCAVGLCLWASLPASTRRVRRVALAAAVSPLAVGACGAVFGFIVWWSAHDPGSPWLGLGKVCLAGLAVAALPLVWALLLLRPPGRRAVP
jgi:hypothetical protein